MDLEELLEKTNLSEGDQSSSFTSETFEAQQQGNVNLDAEAALLGSLLVDNNIFEAISDIISAKHFCDPLHVTIYEHIEQLISRQRVATPLTIKPFIDNHASFSQAHESQEYLTYLVSQGVGTLTAKEYAKTIFDLAVLRSLSSLGRDIIASADNISELTPSEQITDAEQALYKIAQTGRSERGFVSFANALGRAVEGAASAHKRGSGLAGVATKLVDLDKKLGGLHPSDLIILAGRPSMGKTALATNIAFNAAASHQKMQDENGNVKTVDGAVVAFFSLEMSAEQLAARILAEQAEMSSEKIRRGDFNDDEFYDLHDAAKHLENIPLFIDDTPALPLSTLAARCRRLKRQHDLGLVIVDYLQLLRPPVGNRRSSDSRVQELTEISMGLKAIAKELNVPVVALSQLSRQVENRDDKRPQLSDLRESGSIEQDADVVMFVFREEYYIGRKEPREGTAEHEKWQTEMQACRNLAEVIIGKQRHGPIGTVKLQFTSQFTRFSNLVESEDDNYHILDA